MKKIIDKFKSYFFNLILIWFVFLLYSKSSYYLEFIRLETITTIYYLAFTYTIFGFLYYLITPQKKIKQGKGFILFRALKRIIKSLYYLIRFPKLKTSFPKLEQKEKVALLFVIVKIFFLPIMLNFFFANYFSVKYQISNLPNFLSLININSFNTILFPLLLASIFLIDTLWFSFGYTVEAGFLKNKIRSVEPTIIGWVVALACYPPFNGIATGAIGWYANDYILFSTPLLTFIMRLLIIFFLLIYVGATLALGAKSSNLTNRGIVTRGPYAIIRHPAYTSKNLAWWITIIPVFSWIAVLGMGVWSLIYHFRSITEERHLIKDPDYVEYCKKVKYRYIPGVY
ncbi:MAG: methyltransferase [archaeon]